MMRFLLPLFAAVILVSCSNAAPDTDTPENQTEGVSVTERQVEEEEGSFDPVHGKEVWFAIGAVSGLDSTAANGVAQAYVFEDGQSVIVAQVNIPEAPAGSHYEGWLLGADGDLAQAGTFQNPFGDVRHQLRMAVPQDVKRYPKFQVTLEAGNDPRSGTPVAEAQLVHRPR